MSKGEHLDPLRRSLSSVGPPPPPKKIPVNSPGGGMITRKLKQQEREAREAEKQDGRKRPQYWPPRP